MISSTSFSSPGPTTQSDFIQRIKKGERDFFEMLSVPETEFLDASFEELMANESDVVCGVNRVQKNFTRKYFELFDGCLIKHHDKGETKFVFYTTTRRVDQVIMIARQLFNGFGSGIVDLDRHRSFNDIAKLTALSAGNFVSEVDDHVQVWLHEDLTILLQYRTDPLHQFSFMLTSKPQRSQDRTIRRRGTIFENLPVNVHALLNQTEISKVDHFEDDIIRFTDYTYEMITSENQVFDRITVRIFDERKHIDHNIQTHLTLFSTTQLLLDSKVRTVNALVKIYDEDDRGNGNLDYYELEILEAHEFWTGRTWTFNESHGLLNPDDRQEKFAYSVSICDFEGEVGFNLSILGFNNLVSLFTV